MSATYLGQILLVGCGGFIGSGLRFMVSGWAYRLSDYSNFPWGTLVVNVLGCLLIGFLGGLVELRQILEPGQRLFLLVGILGGFTTFSTFAFETMELALYANVLKAGINTALQIVLGFSAAWLGYVGSRLL